MPGLLEEQPTEQPQAAPDQAPQGDTLSPTAPGQPSGEAGEGLSEEAQVLLDEAVEAVYSEENIQNIQEMFGQMGPDGFPQAMGIAVNVGLDELADDGASVEVISEAGGALFEMLLEDLVDTGLVQDVNKEQVMAAAGETIKMWGEKNPDLYNPEEFAQLLQQEVAGEAEMGGAPAQPQQPQGLLEGM